MDSEKHSLWLRREESLIPDFSFDLEPFLLEKSTVKQGAGNIGFPLTYGDRLQTENQGGYNLMQSDLKIDMFEGMI